MQNLELLDIFIYIHKFLYSFALPYPGKSKILIADCVHVSGEARLLAVSWCVMWGSGPAVARRGVYTLSLI